jgi:hypothetical protein
MKPHKPRIAFHLFLSAFLILSINSFAQTAFNVTGGGSYCAGGTGAQVGLSSSQLGVVYQLKRNGISVGLPVAGTGLAINFGNQTTAGIYTIEAKNVLTLLTNIMTGSASVTINALPTVSLTPTSLCLGGKLTVSGGTSSDQITWKKNGATVGTTSGWETNGSSIGQGQTAPGNMFVHTNGDVYVVDWDNDRILKFPNGYNSSTAGIVVAGGNGYGSDPNQLAFPNAVIVDNSGYIYVADYDNNRVQRFPPNSTGDSVGTTIAANGISGAADIILDDSGYLYVASDMGGEVLKFPPGSDENTTGTSIISGYNSMWSIAMDGSGNIYTIDFDNIAIRKFPGGNIVAGGNGQGSNANQFFGPIGIRANASGDLFVTDRYNNRIQMFLTNTTSATTIGGLGGYGSGSSQLALPQQSCLDANGNLYVADQGNNRIQKYTINTGYIPTTTGQYWATVTNSGGCSANTDTVTVETAPAIYNVTGGGNYCSGSNGVPIMLSNSETGTIYQLVNGTTNIGNPVSGTGSTINFGNQTAGIYKVIATTAISGCVSNMAGSAAVIAGLTPAVSITTDNICPGRVLRLNNSNEAWISKILWRKNGTAIDSSIAYIDSAGTTVASAGQPNSIYVKNDTVYVLDWNSPNLKKWAPGATTGVNVLGSNTILFSSAMAFDASGNIYIVDQLHHVVKKWASGGTFGIIVAGGNGDGSAANQLSNPSGVFVDQAGNVYVSDFGNNRIQKWLPNATAGITIAGGNGNGSGASQLSNPRGIFVDPSGNIYIADQSNNRIQKWAPDATAGITVAGGNGNGSADSQLSAPTGLFVDAGGNIYITDNGNNRIQKWLANATKGTTFAGGRGSGSSATQLNNPSAIWISKNNTYIADQNNFRVQKFSAHVDSVYNTGAGGAVYTATATSATGCAATANQITVAQMPTAAITNTNITCNGANNGIANLTINGGTSPYTYNWSNNAITEDLNGLGIGSYSVTMTDANGCTASAITAITQPDALKDSMSHVNVLCSGNNSGSITLTVKGGTAPYSYSWSNGATTQNISGLTTGTYRVTITDANGCSITDSQTISALSPMTTSVAKSNVTCFGYSDGSVDLTVAGGTPPFKFAWSNGETTEDLSNLSAGTYTATITDNNGCTTSAPAVITQSSSALVFSATPANIDCSQSNSGTITVSGVSGGTSPYTYSLDDGTYGSVLTFNGLSEGLHKISVKDAAGCIVNQNTGILKSFCAVAKNDSFLNCANTSFTFTLNQLIANDSIPTGDSVSITDWGTPTVGTVTYNNTNKTLTYTPPAGYAGPATFTYTIKKNDGSFYNVANNHFYQYKLTSGITWAAAKAAASASIKNGMQGYLATITSAAENDFITSKLQGDGWIGASDISYEGVWRWVTGPEGLENSGAGRYFSDQHKIGPCIANQGTSVGSYYQNWEENEPNDCGITLPSIYSPTNVNRLGEHVAHMYGSLGGTWNDLSGAIGINGYIIEYGGLEPVLLPSITSTATVYITNLLVTPGATTTPVSCFGGSNGTATVSATGGTAPYQYSKDDGLNYQSSNSFSGLSAAAYTMRVKDVNGCSTTIAATISQPTILIGAESHNNVNCFGGSNGAVALTVSGGISPYTYSWSNNATTKNISGLAAGTYTATIKDSNNCIATTSVTITQPAILSASETHTNVSCFGGGNGSIDLTVTGGTTPYAYNWSNAAVTEDLNGLLTGSYNVTVTDAKGCSTTKTAAISQPSQILITGTTSLISRNNGTVDLTVSGGIPPYTYSWSNNATTEDLTGLPDGTYSVSVKDANGCIKTATFTITFPPIMALDGVISNVSCNGGNNGSIQVILTGGLAPYSILWGNGSTVKDRTALSAGIYSIRIIDALGDTATHSWTVTQPTILNISASSTNVTIFGSNNGSINLTITGGTAPYSYHWNDNSPSQNRTNLTAGTYTVTVTDANGCNTSSSYTITQPTPLVITGTKTDVTIFSGNNGTITTTTTGGVGPYTYSWTNSTITTANRANLYAGTYTVTVTDANGAIANITLTVNQPALLVVTGIKTDVTIFGGSNGTITTTTAGGVGPYTYVWSDGLITTATRTGLVPGTYTVTVTDANGATAATTLVINQPLQLFITAVKTDVTIFGGSNGTITTTTTGGVGPYTYSWANSSIATANRTGLSAGTYTVTVTDHNGATANTTLTIDQPAQLAITGVKTDVTTVFGGNNGTITTATTGGVGPYTYSWAGSSINTSNRTGLTAGTYIVTVTDANGAIATASFIVNQPPQLVITGIKNNVTVYNENDGSIDITPAGGVGPYSYLWSNNATTEDIDSLIAGSYSVTVTDANGATATTTFTITQPTQLIITGITTNVTSYGGNNGTITTTTTGGVGPYTYIWYNSTITTANRTGLIAGTYTVIVTDANGATATKSFIITQPTQSVFPITSTCTFPYVITLESITLVNGKYEWVWSIRNPNPGNGKKGTVQDLSHWDIKLGSCATFENITAAATSTNGTTWTSFIPTYQTDPSIYNTASLTTGNVIKFNVSTSGSAKTYCKLVTTQNLTINYQCVAYYKSGANTGSGTLCFPGFGCSTSGGRGNNEEEHLNTDLISDISIYPNPNNGNFTINIPPSNSNGMIIVRDVTGKIINRINIDAAEITQSVQINMSEAAKGIYIVEVASNEAHYVSRVSIQ